MNKLRVGVVGLSRGSSLVSTAAHHPQAEIAACLSPQLPAVAAYNTADSC